MIFLLISLFSLFGLLSYYLIFSRVRDAKNEISEASEEEGVSLIICAKNEHHNIKQNAQYWLQQEHSNYEVIIVNDRSTDESAKLLKTLSSTYPQLRFVTIKENNTALKGKRNALWQGIQAAKYEKLVFTDADCRPLSKHWLKLMSSKLKGHKKIVLGYSPYYPKLSRVNMLVQYETLMTALQYFGWMQLGYPYMGVGRNYAVCKELLNEEHFKASNHTTSGDDDLVLQQVMTSHNVTSVLQEDAYTASEAPSSLKEWLYQKSRHYSSGFYYSIGTKFRLGLYLMFNILLLVGIYGGVLFHQNYLLLILLPIKALTFKLMCSKAIILLKGKQVSGAFILVDLLYWHLIPIILIFSIFRSNGWKQTEDGR